MTVSALLRNDSRLRTLGARMTLAFAIMSVVLTIAVLIVIDIAAADPAREEVGQSLAVLAVQSAQKLDTGMYERYREMSLLSQQPALVEAIERREDLANLAQLFDQLQSTHSHYAWIGFVDARGRVAAATHGLLEGASVSSRPWYQNVFNGINVGDVHTAELLANKLPPSRRYPTEPKRFVDIAFPVLSKDGKQGAVLGAHLNWEWAREVTDSVIEPLTGRRSIEVMILSANGVVLLGPPALEGQKLALEPFRDAGSKRHGFVESADNASGRYLIGYSATHGHAAYPGLGWTVLVRQPVAEAYQSIKEIQKSVLVIGMAVALLFSLIGALISRQITRPLMRLATSAHDVATGVRSNLDETITSYPELNALAEAFQRMLVSVKLTEVTLRSMNHTLEGRVAERTRALQASREQLQLLIDNVPAMIACCDVDGRYVFCNKTYLAWIGKPEQQVIGVRADNVLEPALVDSLKTHIAKALAGEKVRFEDCHLHGNVKRYREVSYIPTHDAEGQVNGFYVLAYDVTDRKLEQLSLQHDTRHDILTGLPNRKEARIRIEQAIARSRRSMTECAVLFLDIDRFKHINDTYGHGIGDKVLVQFASRLRQAVRETDLVARLSGDEFVILAEGLKDGTVGSEQIARKVLAALSEPLLIDGTALSLGSSIGIALAGAASGLSPEILIERADAAMYEAKQSGRGCFRFAALQPMADA